MPSDRKQINFRVDDETDALVRALIPVVSDAVGLKLSQSDLLRLGLVELRKKYMPAGEPPRVTPDVKSGKGRAKK
jgi:hypothetical protein